MEKATSTEPRWQAQPRQSVETRDGPLIAEQPTSVGQILGKAEPCTPISAPSSTPRPAIHPMLTNAVWHAAREPILTRFNSRLRNGLPLAVDRYPDRLGKDRCSRARVAVESGNPKFYQLSTIKYQLQWPRRLVYCLPMRTLVEQTRDHVRNWLEDTNFFGRKSHAMESRCPYPHGRRRADERMGYYPEHHAILIGTQDMLLSRALNRGYGMSRYRWPMHFGLLNNDGLWVLDEIQLMGVGVETSAQLDAFRDRLGAWGAAPTWWMSATLDEARIQTVDQRALGREIDEISLSTDESASLAGRLNATKRLTQAAVFLDPATKKNYARELVRSVVEKTSPDALTLVILNRVGRAQETYRQLLKLKIPAEQIALIHSRFRRGDRKKHEQLLFGSGKRIVVATQAIEAGVDVSARVLITELAPWPSLVQRFGRCNRYGECADGADVFWVDVQPRDVRDELALPYDFDEFAEARRLITPLADASSATLRAVTHQPPRVIRPVIRRCDLLDLFDTTPDIAGHDLDVSRYIRDGDDNDIQVFWRASPSWSPLRRTARTRMRFAASPSGRLRRSRTTDQMVQAARSGRQNIAEGSRASATSSQTELRLVNVARASLDELLLDYEDFLRQRGMPQWAKDDSERDGSAPCGKAA